MRQHPGHAVAVVLCAGQGTRMGASGNKVFLPLGGRPLLTYALDAFEQAGRIDEILLVSHPAELDRCQAVVEEAGIRKVSAVVPGGESRHQSEQCALETLRARITAGEIDVVLIHDGARPFIAPPEIDALVTAARDGGAAMLASALREDEVLLRIAPDSTVLAGYSSGGLVRAQTPQAFDARALLAAYDAARAVGFEGTDTASSLERMNQPVRIVAGSSRNLKVTTPDDLLRAEALLRLGGD